MFGHLPLTALRAFEAAARLRSFKLAAAELHVTPTAVSHQVRQLERDMGVTLFERLPRRIVPTAQGRALHPRIHDALLDMAEVMDRLGARPGGGTLTVSTTQSFAALWLVPRLPRLQAAYPGIALSIQGDADIVDLLRDRSIDVAIRYNAPSTRGLHVGAVFGETFGVYGAPRVVSASRRKRPPLISIAWRDSRLYEDGWRRWCDLAGVDWMNRPGPLHVFTEEHYAVQAAIAGQGLMLASSLLMADNLHAGVLRPFRPEVQVAGGTYTVLSAPGRQRHPPVRALLDWLAREARPRRRGDGLL